MPCERSEKGMEFSMKEYGIADHNLIHDRMHGKTIHEDMHNKNIHSDKHFDNISHKNNISGFGHKSNNRNK